MHRSARPPQSTEFSGIKDGSGKSSVHKNEEFGGTFGALFTALFFPTYIYGLHMFCNESRCSFSKFYDLERYSDFSAFFDASATRLYLGYAVALVVFSSLSFGGKKVSALPTKQGKYDYVMNGLASCQIFIIIFLVSELCGIPLADFVAEHYFHFIFPSFVTGVAVSVYVYIRSFFVSAHNLTASSSSDHNFFYSFFMGREYNPRFFGVDLKMLFLRFAFIGVILLNFSFFLKSWCLSVESSRSGVFHFDLSFLSLVSMMSVYIFTSLIYEPFWVSTFEIQHEGFGYMTAEAFSIYPFLLTSITKYVFDYGVQLEHWQIAVSIIVFLVGYYINTASNFQKDSFRKNPYNPDVLRLESIPTSQGKKLLVSGFWGFVRHPNYLGEILIHLAFIPYVYNVPPVLVIIFTSFLLIHRSTRDGARCKQAYGSAWDKYCQRVKYVLLPYIY